MTILRTLLASTLLWWGSFPVAHAADLKEVCATYSSGNVTITTTGETVVATSEACKVPRPAFKAVIQVYFNVTTSADSATYKVRVRRETLTGTALGDAVAQTLKVTAAGTEEVNFAVTDERTADVATVVYVATLEIASASANSTVNEAFIRVDLL